MSHLAAIIPEARAPLKIEEVETPHPSTHEILVKNELIGVLPFDAKLAKNGILPLDYPAILGVSFGGTVTSVGAKVTKFKVGDKVAAVRLLGAFKPQYGVFQRYVVVHESTTSKIPDIVDLDIPVSLIGNLTTVVGFFTAFSELERPDFDSRPAAPRQKKRILVYGGTSSLGSFSVQYAAQAGYDVITTTSPKHQSFVLELGATQIIDHTQEEAEIVKQLVANGPYDIVFDSISVTKTINITAEVLNAQGGGYLYAVQPAYGPEKIPERVTRKYASWGRIPVEEKHAALLEWAFSHYLPNVVANGNVLALPIQHVAGGLDHLNEALDIVEKGVSGVKIAVRPCE
ncbi:GroES-like protein [Corynespora cassiicola Philippines]|uniref:GroES-like protein n=1 Tax=Corynespora cassiicola Philippines TaxID=1448308 RepID=A0A2T2N1K2_CORCC|nr:GroES-like protein [Corynespora cassiicola Philippines]